MTPRIDYRQFSQEALQAMLALEKYLAGCGLDHKFMHLLKLRASQINGCAYCIDMHSIDARAAGETEQRLYALDAWRETPFFDDRERAALAWIEAVTLVSQGHVPDAVYDEAQETLQREGARRPDLPRVDDQRVEPPCDLDARGPRPLQGANPHGVTLPPAGHGAPLPAASREADRAAAIARRRRVGACRRSRRRGA